MLIWNWYFGFLLNLSTNIIIPFLLRYAINMVKYAKNAYTYKNRFLSHKGLALVILVHLVLA